MLLFPALAQVECNQEWTVNNTTDANILSAALEACEGGTVSVLWTGQVFVEQEIAVTSGTSLSISGVDLGASAVGNGSTSLFSVMGGATLNIEDMILMNGTRGGTGGGAIFANKAEVHISGTTVFTGNQCSSGETAEPGGGGAVRVENESLLTWTGNTIFFNNTAMNFDGGALYCSYSKCSGKGTTTFEANFGNEDAGAVRVSRSEFSCSGTTRFIDNATPGEGGAVLATDDSMANFYGTTNATGNSAASGGAFSLAGDSLLPTRLTFEGSTSIVNNTAEQGDGGGMAVAQGCNVSWEDDITFAENVAGDDGGGLAIDGDSLLSIGGKTLFSRNSAGSKGGAVYANANVDGITYEGAVFEFNSAAIGGAIASYSTEESAPNYYTGCTFRHNSAASTGGAIEISIGDDEISNSTFINNLAGIL